MYVGSISAAHSCVAFFSFLRRDPSGGERGLISRLVIEPALYAEIFICTPSQGKGHLLMPTAFENGIQSSVLNKVTDGALRNI